MIFFFKELSSNFWANVFDTMILYWSESFVYVLDDFDLEDEEIPLDMIQSCKCLLVRNDEMRYLLFQLLGTSSFPRWKEKHHYMQHYHLWIYIRVYIYMCDWIWFPNVAGWEICVKRGWSQTPYATCILHYYTSCFLLTQTQIYNNKTIVCIFC